MGDVEDAVGDAVTVAVRVTWRCVCGARGGAAGKLRAVRIESTYAPDLVASWRAGRRRQQYHHPRERQRFVA